MTLDSVIASPVTGLLALIGGVAIVYRLARAVLRLGLAAAETGAAGAMVQASIRHGDLTGMAERRAQVSVVRRTRTWAALETLLWLALLAVPPMAGISRPVFALAALVWLLPRTPIRLTSVARRTENLTQSRRDAEN